MKRTFLLFVMAVASLGNSVLAGAAVTHSGQASAHSVQAVGHAAVAGARFASGSVAVPLAFSGAVGKSSAAAGTALWDAANAPIGDPLPISDKTYMTGPSPDQAIQR